MASANNPLPKRMKQPGSGTAGSNVASGPELSIIVVPGEKYKAFVETMATRDRSFGGTPLKLNSTVDPDASRSAEEGEHYRLRSPAH
jgi:hypothetical protein